MKQLRTQTLSPLANTRTGFIIAVLFALLYPPPGYTLYELKVGVGEEGV